LQNISGTNAASCWQKLAADFTSLLKMKSVGKVELIFFVIHKTTNELLAITARAPYLNSNHAFLG
jgi:hypothetical protein